MYGLIDCNNFFVSCERVFNPVLADSPVIVLSNNDGCAVALSNEAKALGIKRGDPYFKIEDLCKDNGVYVYSGNHRLYGDMSRRVMSVLREHVEHLEVYSIDEAFFTAQYSSDMAEYGRMLVKTIRRNVGIPTSVGFAPTKTLAKIAGRFAKKYTGYRFCCVIDSEEKRIKALSLTDVADVWGIGRRLCRRMDSLGVKTALDFARLPEERVRKLFNVTVVRTWMELNGTPCIEPEHAEPAKKQICCSRSFDEMISDFDRLSEAVASFVTVASRRLREQKSCAGSITVFVHTNRFREDLDQYVNSASEQLDEAVADTPTLASAATRALRRVFRQGYFYKKAGVLLTDIVPADSMQQSLFKDAADRDRRRRLMDAIDRINNAGKMRDTVHIASYRGVNRFSECHAATRLFSSRLSDIIDINTKQICQPKKQSII